MNDDTQNNHGKLLILNALGQQIWQGKIDQNILQLDISSWASGLYIVHLTTDNMRRYATSVAVSH